MSSIRCKHCGLVLTSKSVHDFQSHVCVKAGMVSKEYNHELKIYVPSYPMIAVDGGEEYTRIIGSRDDYEVLDH